MEDEKIITVENEGGKGNPNHAPAGAPGGKGGQFVSGPESGGSDNGDEMGVIELKEASNSSLGNALKDFIGKKKEVFNQEAREFISKVESNIDEEHKEFYKNLTREQKTVLLYESPIGYDKKRLKFATDEQIDALLYAEAVGNKRVQIEQQLELWKKRKKEIEEEINDKLSQNNIDGFSGIWAYSTKYPSDWAELKENGSIEKKRNYYNEVLNNPNASLSEKIKAKQFLAKLDEFDTVGQEYENLKKDLYSKYLDDLEEIEAKTNELSKELHEYDDDSEIIQLTQSYIDKFIDKNAIYSKERKNKAVWFKSQNTAYNHFSGRASSHWSTLTNYEKNVIHAYTGSGYSRFNKPLRSIKHNPQGYSFGGEGYSTFSEAVNNLTSAIDKCTWEEDIWVNRYIQNNTKMFRLPGSKTTRTLESMTDDELNSLVGTAFTDGGFFSAGAAKGTGYHTGSIVFNVYCPKGTKMIYAAPYSSTGAGENEMILQRGYEYRITKVEKKGNSYYLDMEVILGSDANKPMGNDLKKLGNEYYYKPRKEMGEEYD